MQQIPDNYYDESLSQPSQHCRNTEMRELPQKCFTCLNILDSSNVFRDTMMKSLEIVAVQFLHFQHQKMRYEVLHPNQLIYKRFDQIAEDQKKFYVILQGELGIYLSVGLLPENFKDVEFVEVQSIKMYQHFGHQLFCMAKEDIFEQQSPSLIRYGLIIKAKKQTFVATLNYQYFHAYLHQQEQRKMNSEISRLYDFCLFKEIQYKELKVLFNYTKEILHQFLLTVPLLQGQTHCVFFILRGQYSLVKRTNEQEVQTIGIISEGEIIGEYEILNNIDSRPFSLICQSEKGEVLICDAQLFQNYVFQLIRENLEQTIEAKFNFHQMDKTSIKFELTKLNQHIHRRQSIEEVCKQNKFHYLMRPPPRKVHQSTSEYKGKPSYYQLFVNIYNIASQQTYFSPRLANDERKRRITHYVRNTLKPMQQKLKQALNVSANKTDESISKNTKGFPLHNEMLIQALKRNNDSRFRKTFQKTQSLASISPSKKQSRPDVIDLGENLIIKKQYKSSDKLIYNNQ
ncbi:unnamed protein product (macronuclear) [Paramecium tetraurelia]|uniref:Cyclic nucleotide-binding domain-containing protein n=1 Tax=Paramecium tetraurelia TaxID=5888 RepID=A0BTT2_PARTE|nr:uncharacterized protein GSPATT00032181001 [Paramecium tetraurelia]CAK61949.1 unnamed protein product [Paramecium tetraurelia]|eukprot:XP_001429347.1 hypothetical protein (macronuclear) [Paramecium tetraurelia strain d4-2]